MKYVKPSRTIDFVKSNLSQLNEGVNALEEKLLSLPKSHMINVEFKPNLAKEVKELKFSCEYKIILGNNESEWLLKQTYTDQNPTRLPREMIGKLGNKKVCIAFDLTYNYKARKTAFKIHTISGYSQFENHDVYFRNKYIVEDNNNNVVSILYRNFGWGVEAKSKTSVRRKAYDFERFSRILSMCLDAIDQDSIGIAVQAVNMAQTETALSVLK